ncbi:hypothetical protein [Kocuria sp. CPCC 205263]|uniref:hypothetical protein n=1 Tax=Kocuria sp. CPCC 205263 TaxID=3073555 RepID=UPI0034D4791D
MSPPRGSDMVNRRLYALILLALVLAVGHHLDHIIRGNHVGWPLTAEVNAFTFSLITYPLILTRLALSRAGVIGPGTWVFLSGGGAIFLTVIHFGPWALEPPDDIIDLYDPPLIGWLAFGWLLALIAVLIATTIYEARRWLQHRSLEHD